MAMVLITGGTGKLGTALGVEFPQAARPTRAVLDISDDDSVVRYIEQHRPSTIIHTAAMTDVRKAQHDREGCWNANVRGTERLVEAMQQFVPDGYFVYVSTACVFDGERGDYSEDDIPDPKNFYAVTKLMGEMAAKRIGRSLIIRTNFVAREPWPYPRAFVDRFGTYLFADDVAHTIRPLVEEGHTGLVHIVGSERMSMFELARITSPDVGQMTLDEVDVPVTVDMTLRSVRIPAVTITR